MSFLLQRFLKCDLEGFEPVTIFPFCTACSKIKYKTPKQTSWGESISPRLRQLAWAELKAKETLQANKLIDLLNFYGGHFRLLFRMCCFGSTFSKIWPAIAETLFWFWGFLMLDVCFILYLCTLWFDPDTFSFKF